MTNSMREPAWAGNELRLDPARLPQRVCRTGRDETHGTTFTLNKRGAVLHRILPQSGLPLSLALPAHAFKGVAARAMDHGGGPITVTLELHHEDSALCVPLLVAHDLDDIAADWHSWSRLYGLPMLMIEADGSAARLDDDAAQPGAAAARAHRDRTIVRPARPRFTVRRRMNELGLRLVVAGREIVPRR